MENTDPKKKLEWLVSNLMMQVETAVLQSKAYERVLTKQGENLLQEAQQVLTSAPFDSARTKCMGLKTRVLEAVRKDDLGEVFGSLGEFLGTLNQAVHPKEKP